MSIPAIRMRQRLLLFRVSLLNRASIALALSMQVAACFSSTDVPCFANTISGGASSGAASTAASNSASGAAQCQSPKFALTVRARPEELYEELTDLDFGRLQPDTVAVPTSKNSEKTHGFTRTVANFLFDMSGIDYSKEGADIALEKFNDIRSEFTKQCELEIGRWDTHKKACLAILELADSVGTDSALDAVNMNLPFETLTQHLGRTHAERILDTLVRAKQYSMQVEGPALSKGFSAREELTDQLIGYSLDTDVIYQDLKNKLGSFSNKTPAQRTASKVTYSGLNIAGLVPTIVAPISSVTQGGAIFLNGGPEVDKLLKEMCLAKLLERRKMLLSCEVRFGLAAFEKADKDKNPALKHAAAALLKRVCGGNYLARIDEQKALCQQQLVPGL